MDYGELARCLLLNMLHCDFKRQPGAPSGIVSVNYLFGRPSIRLELSWYEKFNVCCLRIVSKNVVLGTEKRSVYIIFGKAIRPKVFGNWTKKA